MKPIRLVLALLLNTGIALAVAPAHAQQIPANRNPKFNASINPKFNASINPKFNASLDPTKSTWSGFYVFNIDGNPAGVAVVANRRFLLLFGPGGKWTGYLASNGAAGFNWFAVDGEWRGYCVSNSERGFNLFAKDDDWIGFMN